MWRNTQIVLLSLLLSTALALAQQSGQQAYQARGAVHSTLGRSAPESASSLLSPEEGLAVLGAALESRHHPDSKLDCSHLVNTIYERAGFPFGYASSSDIYAGVDEFQRVSFPRSGDLIAWRGHVGIIVSPAQHSFFSSMRSGRGVEEYDSKYWQQRGHPRFFRYLKATSSPVLTVAKPSAGLKLTSLRNAESHGPDRGADGDAVIEDSTLTAYSVVRLTVPRVLSVQSSRPRVEQLRAALQQMVSDTSEALQARDVLKLSQPLIVFDSIEIQRVQLKGNQGWAEVLVTGASPLMAAGSTKQRLDEHQHWGVDRVGRERWEVTLPPGTIYLPRTVAVQIMAHQLAALTDANPPPANLEQKKVQLARLLNELLAKDEPR